MAFLPEAARIPHQAASLSGTAARGRNVPALDPKTEIQCQLEASFE